MYIITREKKGGSIAELKRNNKQSLFIFRIDNDAEARRFNSGHVAETLEKLFQIIDLVVKNDMWKRI